MKPKSKLTLCTLLIGIVAVMVLGCGIVGAVECNVTDGSGNNIINSSSISNGCSIISQGNYIMSGETFYLSGSQSGAMRLVSANVTIIGNGSKLIGNRNYYGINISSNLFNITLTNFSLVNYSRAIFATKLNDSWFNNIFVYNSSDDSIRLYDRCYRNLIENNYIENGKRGISLSGASLDSPFQFGTNYNIIRNNIIINSSTNGIDLFASSNWNNITNNIVTKTNVGGVGIIIDRNSHNNIVDSNNVTNTYEDGIQIQGLANKAELTTNNTISNNIIINASYACSGDAGTCAQGIYLNYWAKDNLIINNIIESSRGNGIDSVLNATNNTIRNNTINNCRGNCIRVDPYSLAFIYDNILSNYSYLYNYNFQFGSVVEFSGTTFQKSHTFYTNLILFSGYKLEVLSNLTSDGIQTNQDGSISIYNISDFVKLRNINLSGTGQINIYGSSNALVYTSNGSAQIGSGNINIILQPNNYSYILDNFNLTEGINRQYSPLYFTSSTPTSKHIASNLSESVNVSITLNVQDCNTIGRINYVSDDGIVNRTWNSGDYTCSNGFITFDNIYIDPATNSNVFTLEYNQAIQGICSNGGLTIYGAISIVGVILTISLVGFALTILVLVFKGTVDAKVIKEHLDFNSFLTGILIIMLTGLLLVTLAFVFNGVVCSALGG